MATPRGRTAFKKKDGILTLSDDQKSVTWTPLPGSGPPVVSLALGNITNLQQTPDTAAKVMLKIFEKAPQSSGEPASYLFHFNAADAAEARQEAKSLKDLLSRFLTEIRSKDPSLPKAAREATPQPAAGASGSAAMSFASTVNAKPASARWFDDGLLKGDIELQQTLLRANPALHKTYMDARATKPESISDSAFNGQFWTTRTGLLRSHAIENHQRKGAYNVLAIIRPRAEEGEMTLTISKEQIQLIFDQHPLVKRIYNEHVGPSPKLKDHDFWSRFFLSHLFKKMRGERILAGENADNIIDKYDFNDDLLGFSSRIMAAHIPHMIDIEGNEENQGGVSRGNQKDVEMRPRTNVPIVKSLNMLSEKIMANVAPTDPARSEEAGGSGPVGGGSTAQSGQDESAEGEATYAELALRDLQPEVAEQRIVLNVKEQSLFFSGTGADGESSSSAAGQHGDQAAADEEARVYARQDPSEVLFDIQADVDTLEGDGAGGIDIHAAIGVDDDSDSGGDDDGGGGGSGSGGRRKRKAPSHVGSRAARAAAQEQVLGAVRRRAAELYGSGADNSGSGGGGPLGLPAAVAERCYLTNATTVEFLRQFWGAFLSGDAERAGELGYMVESLKNSMRRIEDVADEAEKARDAAVAQRRREIWEHFERTKKKIRWKADMVGGGRNAVMQLLSSTIVSINTAQEAYQKALAAEGIKPSTEG